uniref:CSON012781 protein n=1 Tax=Culicoides sonorensis TaxID=179676 RepID=A0A336KKV5_CULSO
MEKREIDPELDPCSAQFNPEKALKVKHIPTTKNYKIFDNVQMLQAAAKRINNEIDTKLLTEGIFVRSGKKVEENPDTVVRKFLPHQGLVEKKKSARHTKNLLVRLEAGYEGPLGSLKKLMDDHVKAKIYVRKEHGVRGSITGYIEAFDKHWNMAVTEVEEIWTRRKLKFSQNEVIFENTISSDIARQKLKRMGIKIPEIKEIKSLNRKYVEIKRHVPQLLIRGEQIVLVVRLEES